jgi:hypothetical protein
MFSVDLPPDWNWNWGVHEQPIKKLEEASANLREVLNKFIENPPKETIVRDWVLIAKSDIDYVLGYLEGLS